MSNIDFQNGFLCGLTTKLNLIAAESSDFLRQYYFSETIKLKGLKLRDRMQVDYVTDTLDNPFAETIRLSDFAKGLIDSVNITTE